MTVRSLSSRLTVLAACSGIVLMVGCMTIPSSADDQAPPEPGLDDFRQCGLVDTSVYQVRAPNGRLLVIRGKLHNPYDVPVSDVRLIIRLLAAGDQPRELDRVEKDLDVAIEPGGEVTFSRDMDTSYAYVFDKIAIAAFATHRGATEFPTPSPDMETQATTSRAVVLFSGDIPLVTPNGTFTIHLR